MPDWDQFRIAYMDYRRDPGKYKWDDIEKLAEQAQQLGVRFEMQDPGFSAVGIAKTFSSGLLSGFTTLPVGDKPINEVESIAHSLGHLIGFIGGVPVLPIKGLRGGLMLGKVAEKAIRGAGTKYATSKIGKEATREAVGAAAAAGGDFTQKWLGKSIPMNIADYAMGKMGKTAVAATMKEHVQNNVMRQMIRHGAHLGTASKVSGWSDAIQEETVMGAFKASAVQGLSGVAFGAGFAMIGNIPLKGMGFEQFTTGDKLLKGLAGATFQASPGYFQGATTSENVYTSY